MSDQQISGYSSKEANRMQILAELKAKEEKEKRELQKKQALKQKKEEEERLKKEAEQALALKKAKRKETIKKVSISSVLLLVFSFILFVPKVNEIKYQSLEGTSTAFFVTSDILGFYDSQIVDNPVYDSVNIDESKSKISFCSTKHKNVHCFDTFLVERKSAISSFGSYFSYLQDKFSHTI